MRRGAGLRVLLAPCGFKEGLSVEDLVRHMATGVRAAAPAAEILTAPMVDGGEGFTRALVGLTGGTLHPALVSGPVGQPLEASVGLLGGRHAGTAVIEIAAAAGLRHVPKAARDPLRTTSWGVGELIRAALDLGRPRLLIGCGDSGVNDGGAGLAQALGVRLADRRGRAIGRGGGALSRLASVDVAGRDPRLARTRIEVAVNWNNRLLGPAGVARVFGPQKGASPAAIVRMEHGLETLARVVAADLGIDVAALSGAGASGGLGAGLHAFLGARLRPRIRVLTRFLDLDGLLDRADLVLTAEGAIDQLTPIGKLPAEIGRRARARGVPVIALVGSIGSGAALTRRVGIGAYVSVLNRPCSLEEAMVQAPALVAEAAEQVMRIVLLARGSGLRRRPGTRLRARSGTGKKGPGVATGAS